MNLLDFAYTVVPTSRRKFALALCERNVQGYRPVYDYGPYDFADHAEGVASRLNARNGVSAQRARNIVRTTMVAGTVRPRYRPPSLSWVCNGCSTSYPCRDSDAKVGDTQPSPCCSGDRQLIIERENMSVAQLAEMKRLDLTADEFNQIEAFAAAKGHTVAIWARDALLAAAGIEPQPPRPQTSKRKRSRATAS